MTEKLFAIEPVVKNKQERHEKHDCVLDIMDALTAPILTHSSAWIDAIPKRLLDLIPLARLMSIMRGERMATLEETTAFIMTRTFDAPMDHDWANIYCWLGCTVSEQHWNGDHWKEIMHDQKDLSQYQMGLLKQLRIWIYERRRKIVKSRMKGEEPQQKEPPQIIEQQLELF